MSRVEVIVALALVLVAAPPSRAEDYWQTTRRGANLFDRTESKERLQAAAAAHIDFVRVAPNKWPGAGRDFLLGDAAPLTALAHSGYSLDQQ